MTTRPSTFATALNCMDGRAQLPVNKAVRERFGVDVVDTITEAGIVKFLSDQTDAPEAEAALAKVRISLEAHGSRGIAVAAHEDCAGNPVAEMVQKDQLARAVAFLRGQFPAVPIIGLWVGADWQAREAVPSEEGQ